VDSDRPIQQFPDVYSIKAVGKDENNLVDFVVSVITSVVGTENPVTHYTRPSRSGSYLSVTASFTATSQEQLDQVFAAVSAQERIVWVL